MTRIDALFTAVLRGHRIAALSVATVCAIVTTTGSVAETFSPITQDAYFATEGYMSQSFVGDSADLSYPFLDSYFTTMGMAPDKTKVECNLKRFKGGGILPIDAKAMKFTFTSKIYTLGVGGTIESWGCAFACSVSVPTRVDPRPECPTGTTWVDNCDRRTVIARVTQRMLGKKIGAEWVVPSDEEIQSYCQAWVDSESNPEKSSVIAKCALGIKNGHFTYEAPFDGEGQCVSGATGTSNDDNEEESDLDENDTAISYEDTDTAEDDNSSDPMLAEPPL